MGSSSPHHTRSLLNMEPEARVRQTDREINLDISLVINICNWIAICCYIYIYYLCTLPTIFIVVTVIHYF